MFDVELSNKAVER